MSRKKPTKKAQPSQGSVLSRLVKNKLLCSKVNECLDTEVPYDRIVELCAEYDFDISKSSLSRYKDKREEALNSGVPIEDIIDGRSKNKVISIRDKEATPFTPGPVKGSFIPNGDPVNDDPMIDGKKLFSDFEFLDSIIEKGFKAVTYVDVLDPAIAMKAVEIKNKIGGDNLKGMTIAGLKELNMRNLALENQLTEVINKFIPVDKQEEVLDYMEEVENNFYANLDLTEEQKRLTDLLKTVNGDRG